MLLGFSKCLLLCTVCTQGLVWLPRPCTCGEALWALRSAPDGGLVLSFSQHPWEAGLAGTGCSPRQHRAEEEKQVSQQGCGQTWLWHTLRDGLAERHEVPTKGQLLHAWKWLKRACLLWKPQEGLLITMFIMVRSSRRAWCEMSSLVKSDLKMWNAKSGSHLCTFSNQ